MSHSGLVLGHWERQSRGSSENWLQIAKYGTQAAVVQEATSFMAAAFMAAWYGYTKSTNDCCASESMERIKRQSEYCFRSKPSATSTPRLINAKRSKFQAGICWRQAYESSHPHPPTCPWMDAGYREQNTVTCGVSDECAIYYAYHLHLTIGIDEVFL